MISIFIFSNNQQNNKANHKISRHEWKASLH